MGWKSCETFLNVLCWPFLSLSPSLHPQCQFFENTLLSLVPVESLTRTIVIKCCGFMLPKRYFFSCFFLHYARHEIVPDQRILQEPRVFCSGEKLILLYCKREPSQWKWKFPIIDWWFPKFWIRKFTARARGRERKQENPESFTYLWTVGCFGSRYLSPSLPQKEEDNTGTCSDGQSRSEHSIRLKLNPQHPFQARKKITGRKAMHESLNWQFRPRKKLFQVCFCKRFLSSTVSPNWQWRCSSNKEILAKT